MVRQARTRTSWAEVHLATPTAWLDSRPAARPRPSEPFTIHRQAILSTPPASQAKDGVSDGAGCVNKAKIDKLHIVHYPAPVLKKPSAPLDTFGPEVRGVAERMLELMREASGVGLAAPQVGLLWRLFVCNGSGEPEDDLICINPELTDLSGGDELEEGCLSIPGVTVNMRRATFAVMKAFDLDGTPYAVEADGLMARIWQHEVDHLNGRLITDTMSPTDEIANRRALKLLEAEYKPSRRR